MKNLQNLIGLFLVSFGLIGLAACDTPNGLLGANPLAGRATESSSSFTVGDNAVGENCRAQDEESLDESGLGRRTVAIYCGDWRSPSARIIEVSDQMSGGNLDSIAGGGLWIADLSRTMQCDAPNTGRILGGSYDARFLSCQLAQGGWPAVALATEVNGRTYVMDGIPAAVTVMERAVGIMAGLEGAAAVPSGGLSSEIEVLLDGQMFGASDRLRDERLLRVAQYYNAVRDYPTSEQRYRDLLELRRQFLEPDHPGLAEPMLGIALQLSNQQRFIEASAMFDTAQPLSQSSYDALVEPRYFLYRGMDRGNRGDCNGGLDYVRLAAEKFENLANEGGWGEEDAVLQGAGSGAPVEHALANLLEARLLICLSRTDEAEAALSAGYSALRISEQAPAHWRSFFESERATMLSELHRSDAGSSGLETAIEERQELFTASRPEAIDMLSLGDLQVERGDTARALSYYRRGTAILTDRGEGVRAPQIWGYLQLLQRMGEERPSQSAELFAEMFGAGQLVQSALTAQTIQATAVRLASGDQEVSGLIRQLQDVESNIFDTSQRLDIETTRPEGYRDRALIQSLIDEKAALIIQQGEIERAVQSAAPAYNQLLQRPVGYERVMGLIQPNEAIVQVLPGFTDSFVFFVTHDEIRPVRIEIGAEEFHRAVGEIRVGLVPTASGRLAPYDTQLAHALYRSVLGQFDEELNQVDHLISIPSGPLTSLPFGILVRESIPQIYNYDYRNVAFLARDMSISLMPSVRSFADLRELVTESQAPRPFIGFGDFQPAPLQTAADDSCEARQLALQSGASTLPETVEEIGAASRSFGAGRAPLHTGNDFTESTVAAENLSDYRVVYFATHGVMPGDLECELQPALLTSVSSSGPGPDGFTNNDGFLTSSEILSLELDADLIVLSACNTGGGDGQGGESLSGLARSFFYSGARAMLVSHWYVESESTVRTMTGMFEELGRTPGLSSAEALRRAQMGIFEDAGRDLPTYWSHPIFWGAFTFVGDGARSIQPGVVS